MNKDWRLLTKQEETTASYPQRDLLRRLTGNWNYLDCPLTEAEAGKKIREIKNRKKHERNKNANVEE